MLKKIKSKLKEQKGVDNTIEMGVILIILFIVLFAIIGFCNLLYMNYKVAQFTNETVRIAELYGEVGDKSLEQIEKLKNSIGIDPVVKFSKTGKVEFMESITCTVELPYKLKIPFLDINIKIKKSASGVGEVYWK
ncbi:DUF4320 family protein [[Clostridium] colinum]|uniref:DUF4320 family protein n=1 Tax=[Clostridium] colinum TaxID=36835 RepID=UPI002024AA9A|nr:DUF4320 family protein [[Clostridium] colinum]